MQEAAQHATPRRLAAVGAASRDAADNMEGKIIRYMFLFRLLPTMQSLLGEDDTSTIANLAARADALMDAKAPRDQPKAASVEESMVAAAGTAPPSSSHKRKPDWGKKKKPAAKKNHGDGGGPWQDMGLCWSHYNWGSKARNCKPPSGRAEN